MKKYYYLLFLMLLVVAACNNQQNQSNQNNFTPKVVKANGYIVPKDNMAAPKVIKINKSKLKVVKAGKPKVVATNTNIHKAGKPKIVKAGKPRIIKIGSDTFLLPKKVKAIGKVVPCKMPKPVKAALPVMKDNATCNIQYLDVDQGMNSSYVNCMLRDKTGNLWFGTGGGGVSKYDGESFTHFTEKEGLSNNNVRSIIEDKTGNLWFGTDGGGVSKYDGESFTHFTEKEGLSNNTVWSIIEAPFEPLVETNLYFATEKGISNFVAGSDKREATTKFIEKNDKINSSSNNEVKWIIFKKRDGLKAEDFFQNSALIDSKGNGWWGSGKALTRLNIKDYKLPPTAPLMQMEDIELNESFIDYRSLIDTIKDTLKIDGIGNIKFTGVAAFNNYPKELELPYNLNHLTFSFSAIDWAAPHKLQYQYKLVGLDKNWSELSHEHKADYRNIPFGKFTFKVRAIGIAGKWSNTFEYAFVIHPPWWRAWWAYGLYFIVFVGSVWYYIKWREKLLKQRQKELEQTVEIRTAEVVEEKKIVEEQKKVVEEKNHEILDSINYAKRIQTAILPQPRVVKEFLKSSFVLYIPKDIVAGDFYWMENIDQTVYIAACDCTGHGVPGALVSVVCNNALNRALNEYGKRLPSEIFDKTRELVIENFARSDEEVKDGMDASLAALDVKNRTLLWSGANNPLWIIRKDVNTNEYVFEDIKADKQPIGKGYETKPFTTHQIQLNEGDAIYLFTDGYADQFGGEENKKMTKAKFRALLLSLAPLPMEKQRTALLEFHDQYRGNEEQVDDICVIGVRV